MDCSPPGSSIHWDSPRKKYWSGLPSPPPHLVPIHQCKRKPFIIRTLEPDLKDRAAMGRFAREEDTITGTTERISGEEMKGESDSSREKVHPGAREPQLLSPHAATPEARVPRTCDSQQEKPPRWKATTREGMHTTKTQHNQKKKKRRLEWALTWKEKDTSVMRSLQIRLKEPESGPSHLQAELAAFHSNKSSNRRKCT